MPRFKHAVAALALSIAVISTAEAACIGSGNFQTCNDNAGNSYTVNRFGNTTMMNGFNAQTGSTWSQNSNRFGNTVIHNGETNGNPWSMTQQNLGGGFQTFNGIDSRGRSFSHTCSNLFGCD